MIKLKRIKLKRLFVDDNGEYTDIPKPYEFVKDFMVSHYEFSSNDDTFRKFYNEKYVPIMTDYRYLNMTKKFTLGRLFGISDYMITADACRERGYNEDEIKSMLPEIKDRRIKFIQERASTIPPIDDGDVKNLIYSNGRYINTPLPYDFVKGYIVKYQNFNEINEDRLRDFYEHNYIETIKDFAYWDIRNERHFGIMFNVYSLSMRNRRYWQERGYSDDVARSIVSNLQDQVSESSFVSRYGSERGRELYKKYIERDRTNVSISNKKVWKEGGGYPYSKTVNPATGKFYRKDEIGSLQREYSMKGSMKAKEMRKHKPVSVFQKQYWMDLGFDEVSAIQQVKMRMAINNIEYYIEKYGPEEGPVKYKERIEKYKHTCESKSEEEKAIWNRKKVFNIPHGVSRVATKFFDNIKSLLNMEGLSLTYMYGDKEFYINDEENSTIYFYDCYIKECNMIIEFNGVKFHPNPDKMTADEIKNWESLFYHIPGEVQIERDRRKKEIAEESGYRYVVVWEDDNMESVINNIVNEIKRIIYA